MGNETIQLNILTALAKDRQFLREMAPILKPEYFTQDLYEIAASTILETWKKHGILPAREGLLSGMLDRLQKSLHLKDPSQHKKTLIQPVTDLVRRIWKRDPNGDPEGRAKASEFCRRQEVQMALREAEDLLQNEEADTSTVQSVIQAAFRRVATQQDLGIDFFPDTGEFVARMTKNQARSIKTGFSEIDRWMGGGMDPGTETIVMAPPKGGKSTFLINMSFNALLRHKVVVYFSHEISQQKIELRYTARIANIDMNLLKKDPAAQKKGMRARALFWSTHKPQLFIKDYPTKTATCDTMRSYLYSLEGERGVRPDLIVVDYADVVRSTKQVGQGGERFAFADVYEQLRAMASEFDCPVLTASRCKRDAVNKVVIEMEDIAEAYEKCSIADHIFAICASRQEKIQKTVRLYYAGSREGDTGRAIRCSRDWAKSYIEDLGVMSEADIQKAREKRERDGE